MTDRTIPVSELFDLARKLESTVNALRVSERPEDHLLAAGLDCGAHAVRQLEATGRAIDVALRLPEGTEYERKEAT